MSGAARTDPPASPLAAGLGFLGSRIVLAAVVIGWAAGAGIGPEGHPLADGVWWLDRLVHWDSYHYLRIADEGYFAPGRDCCDQAFFPGYPLAMRALSPVFGGHTAAAGVVVTLLAGAAAAGCLWGLARDRLGPSAATRALLALGVAPTGVFFVAVYTEAAFLAAAVGAWWAASRGRWWWAGALCALAVSIRVNGLFVLAGLLTWYAVRAMRSRGAGRSGVRWHHAVALLLPLVPFVAHMAWLRSQTGSWDAWRESQSRGWERRTLLPWESVAHQMGEIASAPTWSLTLTRSLDLGVVLGGVAVIVLLVVWRWWPEAVYLSLSVGVLLTTSTFDSAGRYALTWFPAYLVLARLGERPRTRWLWWGALAVSTVLLPVLTGLWVHRRWIG